MKIAVTNNITNDLVKLFIKQGIEVIVYYKIDNGVDYKQLSSNFKLVNAFEDTSKANWFNYELVSAKLNAIESSIPEFFIYNGINLKVALNKDLFWAMLAKHSLLFQSEKLNINGNEIIDFNKKKYLIKKATLLKKLFFDRYYGYSFKMPTSNSLDKKVAFRINNLELKSFYGDLLIKLGRENIISFQTTLVRNSNFFEKEVLKDFSENIISNSCSKKYLKLNLFTRIKLLLLREDQEFLIGMIDSLNKLKNHVDEYNRLFEFGVRKVLLNAGENEGEGNVVCALAKKHNALTYNYMNGTKARDPQNVETFFDFWFMPDQNTRDLILSYCKPKEKQLPVTGHLLKELAEKHTYAGTLDYVLEKFPNKKIIALLTSKIYASERNDVVDFLNEYTLKNPDLIVLIRKHPSEERPMITRSDNFIQLEEYSGALSQISLFDLLLKADVAISFSSMVSYQATWFNVPSINYEVSENSRLPFVDNQKVFHVSNISELEQKLNAYLFNWIKPIIEKSSLNCSDKMMSIITGVV